MYHKDNKAQERLKNLIEKDSSVLLLQEVIRKSFWDGYTEGRHSVFELGEMIMLAQRESVKPEVLAEVVLDERFKQP